MKQLSAALFCLLVPGIAAAQGSGTPAPANHAPASAALATDPWEYGVFFGGGFGVGDRSDFSFTNAGVRVGKVLTNQYLPGFLRGQFEYAADFMPYWQSFTPAPSVRATTYTFDGQTGSVPLPYGGGTFTGLSITPIILRWDLKPTKRIAPYLQGAGGLIWTNHKYPPDVLVPEGTSGGTSVWNFTPQFGVGLHYFVRDRQAIDLQASAVHISSASLGDRNPGVNASVQFQIGYSWWK
ncbi:acyloxyacyl hydrolase [Acidipila sp. EB88]|uniref:acyloxyacyl hydrolase n=1 Tax=Acidipila sp. EB88 TaxID=2305226 RepID=UPI000F5D8892|nr:acyloxyacyl hydrolase [Acidipila sp. EB88]RRA50247.1 acyloxyacyl hydrolase [Acidipila sp. EB88]